MSRRVVQEVVASLERRSGPRIELRRNGNVSKSLFRALATNKFDKKTLVLRAMNMIPTRCHCTTLRNGFDPHSWVPASSSSSRWQWSINPLWWRSKSSIMERLCSIIVFRIPEQVRDVRILVREFWRCSELPKHRMWKAWRTKGMARWRYRDGYVRFAWLSIRAQEFD